MAIGNWGDAVLCRDKDLSEFETNVLRWVQGRGSAEKWISKAKDLIAQKLRYSLRTVELATDEDDVLDLIADITPLKDAACYLSLHLICNDASTGADGWAQKAEMYWHKWEKEWPQALGLVSLDTDESGTLEDSEKYNVNTGVTLVRGS